MFNHFIFVSFFIISFFVGDPTVVSTTQILSKALQDPKLKSKKDLELFAAQQSYRLPFLKSTELRAGTKTLIFDESRYSMRFGFNSIRERQSLKKFPKLHSDIFHTEYLNQLNSKLLDYNKLILDYFANNIEVQYKDSLMYYLKLKHELYGQYLKQGSEIKIKELVKSEEELINLFTDQGEIQLLKSNYLEKLRNIMNVTEIVDIGMDQLVQFETIERRIISHRDLSYSSMVTLQKSNELNLIKQNILLEKRKESNWFSYFQMEYTDSPKATGLNENLSARVGIRIPIGGSSNKKIRELELDARSIQDQISILDTIGQFNQRINLNFLKIKMEEYKKVRAQVNYSILDKLLLNQSVLNQLTTEDLIDLKMNTLKQKCDLKLLYIEILRVYINLLAINDTLIAEPLTDYLTDQMLPIQ